MFEHIIDKHVRLKVLLPKDTYEYIQLIKQNEEHLKPWFSWINAYQNEEICMKTLLQNSDKYIHDEGLYVGILYDGKIIGYANALFDWEMNSLSLGYWISKDYEGKGIVFKVCHSLLKYSFDHYNFNRAELRAASHNVKSIKLAEKLGFNFEGCIRQGQYVNGKYQDIFLFGLLKNEFKLLSYE